MTGWVSLPLKDILESEKGISYGIVQPGQPVSTGVPIVRVSDIKSGIIDTKTPLRVEQAIEANYARTRLRGGELLITVVGTPGQTAIVPAALAGWNVARAVAVLPIREDIGAYWVQLALKAPSVAALIDSRLNTTVQATLNLGDLAKLPILLPPKNERDRIIGIIGGLEGKIELNRRMNETLEAMARAVFKDWFVDFGPTHAKAEGRPPYLAPDLWSLFPDRLDDEGKPEGWVELLLSDVIKRLKVGTLYEKKNVTTLGQVPVLDQSKDGVIGYHNNEANIRASHENRVSVFANHTCAQRLMDCDFSTIQNVIPFVGNSVPTEWVYYASLGKQKFEEYRGHWPSFVTHAVVVPTNGLASAFATEVDAMLRRISSNIQESRTLAATRDLLLPKLMSGEIRVQDAGPIVEPLLAKVS